MLVQKFGGTSMGSAQSLSQVTKIIKAAKGNKVAVVSAMDGVTDELLRATRFALAGKYSAVQKIIAKVLARHVATVGKIVKNSSIQIEIIKYLDQTLQDLAGFLKAIGEINELSAKSQDTIMAVGEKLSARLLAGILTDSGLSAEQVDLEKAIPAKFEAADNDFYITTEKIFAQKLRKVLVRKKMPIVTGYFGCVPGGMINEVGRGYSDFCAALVAAGLKAKKLEIWTDVSGIFSADPRKVSSAKVVPKISSEAAAELAHFGAKVIHPQSINPAVRMKVPVWILNTFEPKARGTEILAEIKNPKEIFTSITSKPNVTTVNIASYRMLLQHNFLAKISEVFAKYEAPIDVVSTSEVSVSMALTVEKDKLNKIIAELKPISKIVISTKKAIICLVGMGIKNRRGVAGEVFGLLGKSGISIEQISQGASEINITFVVDEKEADKAVQLLHKRFFE